MFNLKSNKISIIFVFLLGLAPINALGMDLVGKVFTAIGTYNEQVAREAAKEQATREAERVEAQRKAEADRIAQEIRERNAAAAAAIFSLAFGAIVLVGKGIDYVVDGTAGALTSEADKKSKIKKIIYVASVACTGILIYGYNRN